MPSLTFGVQLSNGTPWPALTEAVAAMDAGRWESAWVFDHFMPPVAGQDETGDCPEGWTLLAALAALTERIRLGILVSGNTYRNPVLLAKMAATVDQISGGRADLGIGASWHEREHEAYGWEFPSLRERSDRLEEACAVIRKLFSPEPFVDFDGQYYQLRSAPFAPQCVQQPHVPIMVGGGGEKRTLRTLALYGDVMNVSGSPDAVRAKIAVLERHCADVGRDPATIKKTVMAPLFLQDDPERTEQIRSRLGADLTPEQRLHDFAVGSADHIIEVLQRYREAGAETLILAGVPANPALLQRLDDEILAKFD